MATDPARDALHRVAGALSRMRPPAAGAEYDLHALAAAALRAAGLAFEHEVPLTHGRADFLCEGVCVEIKRGKPSPAAVLGQLRRYAASPRVRAVLLASERAVSLPARVMDKPAANLCLHALFGVTGEGAPRVPDEDAPDYTADPPGWDDVPDEPAAAAAEAEMHEDAMDVPAPDACADAPDPDDPAVPLPGYLCAPPDGARTYGTLSYNRKSKCWTVKATPAVTEMCKRLFPGSEGHGRGQARFTAHRRAVGDLNWLMLRYPLAVAPRDEERWQTALEDARAFARSRERAARLPLRAQPPAGAFEGTLMPFQQEGLAFLNRTPRALLCDEMGLGKTVQTLALIAQQSAYPCLVVPPPHLVRSWRREAERFLRVNGKPPRVCVLEGLKPYPLPEADIYIAHYLLLRGWKRDLPDQPWRLVVFDEIQELRHAGTEKYSAASLLAEKCDRVLGLSGTPIYNHGGEIWNVVNIIDFHFLGDYEGFTREWCVGYGRDIVKNPETLGEYLRGEGLMLRRVKRDVLPQLPSKRRLVEEIDADDHAYEALMAPVYAQLARYAASESMPEGERALLAESISQGERQATGVAKAPHVCAFVRALLAAGERVLLFAHHHAVMDIYARELKAHHPLFITGRESPARKDEAASAFMNGGTDLLCVSLRAASGLNLERASCVVFGEMDWSPAVHSQAEDRAHRIGQTDSLLCYYLVAARGSDRDIQDALGLKVSQFLGLMGDAPLSPEQQAASSGAARRHVQRMLETHPIPRAPA